MPSPRRLARFDTAPFTLRENCGRYADGVRSCLQRHGIPHFDPVRMDDQKWAGAESCRAAWIDYQRCGGELMDSVDVARAECIGAATAFQQCARKAGSSADCDALEQALWQCQAAKVRDRVNEGMKQLASPIEFHN